MFGINGNFLKLANNYLFATVNNKAKDYERANPDKKVIKLGIGDAVLPLAPAVVDAMVKASKEMGKAETFRGYPPYQGYDFLLEAIAENDYKVRGVDISKDEIFVSDGAKSDCSNILDLFSVDNRIAVQDPVYPVYVDSNVIEGRAGRARPNGSYNKVIYLPCVESNGFMPEFPERQPDIIYLNFPNNPTGAMADYDTLKRWVDYALDINAIILYDGAYEAFITEDKPRSIYEIPNAKKCAIEFRSFSKTAGFTGVRCAYTVIPKELRTSGVSLNDLWYRRQATKFNGVSYVVQRAAEAVYSPEGKRQTKESIDYYLENAKIIKQGLEEIGLKTYGGVNSPYIWVKTLDKFGSWEFFDYLLRKVQIVSTPGEGFGSCGKGFMRLSAFNFRENILEAVERLKKLKKIRR
ncbi:MAG TPA: LL-diaminopimelate aminotransferase [Clostridiales bacterium]|nr:LL-diaminopimelate aminotransferase [Clostridiales bacterium]